MSKTPKSVRSFSVYASLINRLKSFRIIYPAVPAEDILTNLGFTSPASEGETILPAPIGPISTINAKGKEIPRKDLPMVKKTTMVWGSWTDWHGNHHSGLQYRSRNVYQRELIPPPEAHLTIIRYNNELAISSENLEIGKNSEESIVHYLNLFLELFGDIQIIPTDKSPPISLKRSNWKFIPTGEAPFSTLADAIATSTIGKSPSEQKVISHRIQCIMHHNPNMIAIGTGGFQDYIAFGFKEKNLYILESPSFDNATYVFKNDWETLSGLTKKEILSSELCETRLIHNRRWNANLHKTITEN